MTIEEIFQTGTITADSGRGFFWCEADGTHQSVFIHQSEVKGRRVLHPFDRIKFIIEPNPRFPDKLQGVRVEWVGREIARQVSATVQS
jgi:cold shock CspA family protein